LELANKCETSLPKSALGKLIKGEVYLNEQKWDKALENYQQAYEMEPFDRTLFIIVDLLIAQKNQSEAITYLNKALEKSPRNNLFHFKLATIYQSLNDNSQAENHYQTILNEQPDNVLALNNLALLYSQQNNPQAMELAKKAYTLAPSSAEVADTYGYILFKQGQLTEALSLLEKAVSLQPNKNIIQFHLAKAYVANDNNSKAIEILENITKAEQRFSEKNAALDLLNELKAN
jgi:tetratricopeptide (TPR) repeat protein